MTCCPPDLALAGRVLSAKVAFAVVGRNKVYEEAHKTDSWYSTAPLSNRAKPLWCRICVAPNPGIQDRLRRNITRCPRPIGRPKVSEELKRQHPQSRCIP